MNGNVGIDVRKGASIPGCGLFVRGANGTMLMRVAVAGWPLRCYRHAVVAALSSPRSAIASEGKTIDLVGLQDQFQDWRASSRPRLVRISSALRSGAGGQRAAPPPARTDVSPRSMTSSLETRAGRPGFFIERRRFILTTSTSSGFRANVGPTDAARCIRDRRRSDPRTRPRRLKIARGNTHASEFATPAKLRRGQWTIALGNPYGTPARERGP